MKNNRYQFIIAGHGYIGKRHAATIMRHHDCELMCFADPAFSGNGPSETLPVFAHLEEAIEANPDSDAVIIAAPNGLHATLALQALALGKHVLIEKPMALTSTDARAIVDAAEEAGRKAMVVLQNRYAPVSRWLKGLVETQTLGKIFFLEVNCFWNRDERYYKEGSWHGTATMDGGTLYTQFSHFVDMIYWLFGDISGIKTQFNNFSHHKLTAFEDTGASIFNLEGSGIGCFNFSTACWDKNLESSITIIAENGSVKVSGQYMNKIEYCHVKDYTLPLDFPNYDPSDNNDAMLDAMLQAMRGEADTNAHDAVQSVSMIERMYAAARGK